VFGTRSEGLKNEMADYLAAGGTGAELVRGGPDRNAILAALGGEANVTAVKAVATTRLRVQVRDANAVDAAAVVRAGAAGVQQVGEGIIHLVIGPEAPSWAAVLGPAGK
jgi:glucose PTS system EIICB or EIICBA component